MLGREPRERNDALPKSILRAFQKVELYIGNKQTRPSVAEGEQGLAESEEITECSTKTLSTSFVTDTGRQVRGKISFWGDNELERALLSSPSSCQMLLPGFRLTEDGVRCTCKEWSPFVQSFALLAE